MTKQTELEKFEEQLEEYGVICRDAVITKQAEVVQK